MCKLISIRGLAVATVAILALAGCKKQEREQEQISDIATYSGSDREQRLIEGAKKEGKLTIYTSAPNDDIGELIEAFKKKYGIDVEVWRSGSENVLQRVVTEARGKRYTVDVVETNGPELEAIDREKLFQPVKSPYQAQLIPEAIRPDGQWVVTRLNVFVQAYNTNVIKKEDLPKQWSDLADPRWKGKLGIEAEDQDWFAGVSDSLGEDEALRTFREIVSKNGISVRKGHTLLTQLVVSGEVPMGLTTYNYKVDQMRQKGAPIAWTAIGSAIGRPNGLGVTRNAPHPHAAILFYDYEISEEGQGILAKRAFVPVNKLVENPIKDVPLTIIEPRKMIDEYDKWNKRYQELFGVGR